MADKNSKKELIDDLDILLGNDRIKVRDTIDEIDSVEIPHVKTNFRQLQSNAKDTATKVVESLVKFYLDADVITKNDYIDYRKKIDARVIGGFMFQMDMAEYACIKMLEMIDEGELHFKNIEALAKLQETLANITRFNIDYLALIESNWKRIRIENEEMKLLRGEKDDKEEDNGNLKARGTKGLMEAAQNVAKEINLKQPDMLITIDARNTKVPENIKGDESMIDSQLKDGLDDQF